jgi:hypothetical protein
MSEQLSAGTRRVDPNILAYNTDDELFAHHATYTEANLGLTLDPLALWIRNEGQWVPVASVEGEIPPPSVVNATESVAGILELATTAEAIAGTLTGAYAMNPARVKEAILAAITPGAWLSPTLLNSWVNYGAPFETAGYRKTPTGEVQLRGMIKNGTTTNGTVLFTLPAGYRPANTRAFPSVQGGNASCRIDVSAAGDVTIQTVTNANLLVLEAVRFDAA